MKGKDSLNLIVRKPWKNAYFQNPLSFLCPSTQEQRFDRLENDIGSAYESQRCMVPESHQASEWAYDVRSMKLDILKGFWWMCHPQLTLQWWTLLEDDW